MVLIPHVIFDYTITYLIVGVNFEVLHSSPLVVSLIYSLLLSSCFLVFFTFLFPYTIGNNYDINIYNHDTFYIHILDQFNMLHSKYLSHVTWFL